MASQLQKYVIAGKSAYASDEQQARQILGDSISPVSVFDAGTGAPIPSATPPPAASAPANTPPGTGATPPAAPPNPPNTPVAPPTSYTVGAGENLQQIATKLGTNVQALMAANPSITNPNILAKGSSLNLPKPATITPSPTQPLSQVSKAIYGAVSAVPDQNDIGAVTAAGNAAVGAMGGVEDPIGTAIAPIVAQMQGAISAVMAPGPTTTSLAAEYQSLVQSSGLQAIDTQMMNMSNIMNGTEDDIRAEITSAGGFADDSQVQAMATARNNVLMKQYNALAAQQAVAQDFVTNTMQYATADQQERDTQQNLALSKINSATGILGQMAGLQTQMIGIAQNQYQSILTGFGAQGLADVVANDPYHAALAEEALGLPSGTLSDPNKIAQLQNQQDRKALEAAAKTYFTSNGQWPAWAPNGIPVQDANIDASGNITAPSSNMPSTGNPSVDASVQSIVGNESGGDYSAVSPKLPDGSQSYGKYQVLDTNIPSWTKQYYGQSLTPQQFLTNTAAQDAVAQGRIGDLWNQYGNINDVASVWFTGVPYAQAVKEGRKDQATGMTVQDYVAKAAGSFNNIIGGGSSGGPAPTTSTNTNGPSYNNTQMATALKNAAANGIPTTSGPNHSIIIGGHTFMPNGDGTYSTDTQATSLPTGTPNKSVATLTSELSQPNPPTLNYQDIQAIMQNAPGSKFAPQSTAFYREQRSARQIIANYVNNPVYATVSAAPLPFARIQAAKNGDNSISDIELVDSYVTLAKGQGQITEAQLEAINKASSVSDKLNVINQQVSGAGALISADQRASLLALSGSVFDQYAKTYQTMYTQAVNTLAKNHIEPSLWGVVPDFSALIQGATIDTSNN